MTLSCNNPAKVTLKYTSVIPHGIAYLGRTIQGSAEIGRRPWMGHNDVGFIQTFEVFAPNNDTEITWSFEPYPENNFNVHEVTVTRANPTIDPQTLTFPAYFYGRYTNIGFWFEENGFTRWYVEGVANPYTTSAVQGGWYKVDSSSNTAPSNSLINISIGSGTPWELWGWAYKVNIYFDGEFSQFKYVRNNQGSPPESGIYTIEGSPGYPIEEEFIFDVIPEQIKLEKDPSKEFFWNLILVPSPPETEESILFSFEGIEPELLCFAGVGECPENTCPILCGDTICCYNSEGIAIDSFLQQGSAY